MNKCLLALAVSFLTVPLTAAQEQPQFLEVSVVRANVRDAASMSGEIIFQLDQDDVLTVLDKSGDWYFVETSTGRRGYIHFSVVRVSPRRPANPAPSGAAAPADTPSAASRGPIRNADVIAMTEAGLSSDLIIGTLKKAESTEFDLSPNGLVTLKNAGVADEIIRFMVGGDAGLETATPTPQTPEAARTTQAQEAQRPAPAPQQPAASPLPSQPAGPTSRVFGLGGRAGGFTFGVGGSVRYWSQDRLGFQVGVSRFSIGSSGSSFGVAASSSLTVLQFGPALIYALDEPDTDGSVFITPYLGGGLNIFQSSLKATATGFGETLSESESSTNTGIQVFGGAEFVFEDLPRFGVSGDIGYYSFLTL